MRRSTTSLLRRGGLLASLLCARPPSTRGRAADAAARAGGSAAPPEAHRHAESYLPDLKWPDVEETWLFASGDLSEIHLDATPSAADADAARSPIPVAVDVPALRAGERVIAASAGGRHAALLTSEGRLLTAGRDGRGLGRDAGNGTDPGFGEVADFYPLADAGAGDGGHAAVPARGAARPRLVRVVASRGYTVALDAAGRVWSAGSNARGQLCLNDTAARDRFHQVRLPFDGADANLFEAPGSHRKIVDVALGERHTLLLGADGKAYGCGWNHYGQLGVGVKGGNVLSPVEILIDAPDADETDANITLDSMNGTFASERTIDREVIAGIAAGRGSSYFLTSSGHVYSTGACTFLSQGR